MINSSSERSNGRSASQLSYLISSICLLHCLLMPVVILILPAFSAFFTDTVETLLLLSVIPVSIYAFLPTWLKHRNSLLAVTFLIGLTLVLVAQFGIQHQHFTSLEQYLSATTTDPQVIARLIFLISGVLLLSVSVYKNNKHTHVCHNPHHNH